MIDFNDLSGNRNYQSLTVCQFTVLLCIVRSSNRHSSLGNPLKASDTKGFHKNIF